MREKLLREPLSLFAVLAVMLFVGYTLISDPAGDTSSDTISVSQELADRLAQNWALQAGRPASEADQGALIHAYVEEEALYRTALTLDLDQGDSVIRRHLVQKMRLLLDDLTVPPEPGEAELRQWFDENQSMFAQPRICSFQHVFLSGGNASSRAEALLARLREHADEWRSLGDPFMLQRSYEHRSELEVTRLFGQRFAAQIFSLATESWQGPVVSPFGHHLVKVTGCNPPAIPAFEDVQGEVAAARREAGWQDARRARVRAIVDGFEVDRLDEE